MYSVQDKQRTMLLTLWVVGAHCTFSFTKFNNILYQGLNPTMATGDYYVKYDLPRLSTCFQFMLCDIRDETGSL